MKYQNPVLSGFYPDPSVCTDGKKFYLVNSTFQYFPGVTLFESDNLVNWKQIGHVLTRTSQLPLTHAYASGGIFAPTIRYHEGRFYMIVTNVNDGGNFIVYTDDIYGEWSEPVWIPNQGIDPSLLFADGTCYFCGNGTDENGKAAVFVNEIIPESGEAITEPKAVYYGNGGRFLEGPHIYKIGKYYYLMAAEGGTEYGHMEVYARSESVYGPYENYAKNPFLTNRNKGGYPVQGVGHADLVQDQQGNWWLIHLAFRQLGLYDMFHTTGRETFLVPVTFDADGWFYAGYHEEGREEGITLLEMETDRLADTITQETSWHYTFANTKPCMEWEMMRLPLDAAHMTYDSAAQKVLLTGTDHNLTEKYGNPAFIGMRQKEVNGVVTVQAKILEGEGGLTMYMDDHNHYDLLLTKKENESTVTLRYQVGMINHAQAILPIAAEAVTLKVVMEPYSYHFYADVNGRGEFIYLGSGETRMISTEACNGFVGIMIGLFAEKNGAVEFTDYDVKMDRK